LQLVQKEQEHSLLPQMEMVIQTQLVGLLSTTHKNNFKLGGKKWTNKITAVKYIK
jgi:hypothetical protein